MDPPTQKTRWNRPTKKRTPPVPGPVLSCRRRGQMVWKSPPLFFVVKKLWNHQIPPGFIPSPWKSKKYPGQQQMSRTPSSFFSRLREKLQKARSTSFELLIYNFFPGVRFEFVNPSITPTKTHKQKKHTTSIGFSPLSKQPKVAKTQACTDKSTTKDLAKWIESSSTQTAKVPCRHQTAASSGWGFAIGWEVSSST